jgi:hypothetical protein
MRKVLESRIEFCKCQSQENELVARRNEFKIWIREKRPETGRYPWNMKQN